ncbi:MAG: molybdenum cofactor biosynthesis protein MoaE [Gammaproteobacteria bacterium]|nr:molybdenum cofactor biosynthesis protein MoaE [Gammaproteobacteria bacterium]
MKIKICNEPFEPCEAWYAYQQSRPELKGNYGATTVFIGTMRDFNEGDRVLNMTLEHYPGMTEKHLHAIAARAMERWNIQDILIVHRSGEVHPDEPIVLVVVWSAHRAAAYEANRYIMEDLKSKAPFWKKETLASGQPRWVERNTLG